jgi:MFS superfamily sulfate permease-like transporter
MPSPISAATPAPQRTDIGLLWWRDGVAGSIAAIVTIASLLTLGLLAYAPLGEAAIGVGMQAAFTAAAVGGLVVALFGRAAMPTAGVSSATTLILASLVAQLAPSLHGADSAAAIGAVVCVTSACVVMAGVLQLLFGVLRLGSLVRLVPLPVLAGFMNGVAILIVVAQLPLLLGLAPGALERGWAVVGEFQPATLAVGLITAATVWLTDRLAPRAPAALCGLVVGSLLYAALSAWDPRLPLGALAGFVPHHFTPAEMLPLLSPAARAGAVQLVQQHLVEVLLSALLLAVVASLESVLAALAVDQSQDTRHDPDRELLAFGLANILAGACAGLPVVFSRSRALAVLSTGGSSPRAALVASVVTALLFIGAAPLIGLLPLTVLAGLMLTVAATLVDGWTHALVVQLAAGKRTRDLVESLALVAVVCGATLAFGFVAGVGIGVVLSMIALIRTLDRSLVRSRFTAATRPSRRLYPHAAELVLRDARRRVALLQLEGAVFFGNADRLAGEAEAQAADGSCPVLILDLKRVTTIDASGAVALQRMASRLARGGTVLCMAGVSLGNEHGRVLQAFGFDVRPGENCFADVDHAVEAAELRLLAAAGQAHVDSAIDLRASVLFDGLSSADAARVGSAFVPRPLTAGERVFARGEAGSSLFVLTEGAVSIVDPGNGKRLARRRFATLSPGMMFGEIAMLDDEGRTADAVADIDSKVFELRRADIDAMSRDAPALTARLYRNVAVHLSQRLRSASTTLGADAD